MMGQSISEIVRDLAPPEPRVKPEQGTLFITYGDTGTHVDLMFSPLEGIYKMNTLTVTWKY